MKYVLLFSLNHMLICFWYKTLESGL